MIPGFNSNLCSQQIVPVVINSLATDAIENVRLSSCKVLRTLYQKNLPEKDSIRKALKTLTEDKDKDVKEMAITTMKKLDG